MAEGVNTPHSAEQEKGDPQNGQLPNGEGETMEVDQPNIAVGAGAGAGGDVSEENGDQEQQEEREITQTDHLNKSLLTSFLSRLNDPSTSPQFPTVQGIDAESNEDDE